MGALTGTADTSNAGNNKESSLYEARLQNSICQSQPVELEIFCQKGKERCTVKGAEVDCKADQRGGNQLPKDNHFL